MKKLLLILLLLPLAMLLLLYLPWYEDVPVDAAWEVQGTDNPPADALTVRFTGTSTLLFDDGETRWMVDGWFTRPGLLHMLLGKIGPDLEAIERGLKANGVTDLAAVIPMHSHYDHAMDAPEVAKRTSALLMGSESTANIGRGWGLPESQILVFENRAPVQIGRFEITPIESAHFEFADPAMRERALGDPRIDAPLVPPVSAFDYRLGKAYVLHVKHPKGSFVIVGSAGYEESGLQGLQADVVFLGIGGLGSQTPAYREAYWRETVGTLQPERVIPIHYDSLTAPIEGPFRGTDKLMSMLSSGSENTLPFVRGKQAENPELIFQVLPRYAQVVLFD